MSGAARRAWKRLAPDLWPLMQRSAAATVAWLIAKRVVNHHEPFFAPIAAVAALNTSPDERSTNTIRLLLGVLLGILSGELCFRLFGGGYGTLAAATFMAMGIARAVGGTRIVIGQSASSAILTVVAAYAEIAASRLEDALIGAGVALVFTQFIGPPEPVRLLQRAQSAALHEMSIGLGMTAKALRQDDPDLADTALSRMREMRDRLSELSRLRRSSAARLRRPVIWWSRRAQVLDERNSAARVDLLGGNCLMLTRLGLATSASEGRMLSRAVGELAEVLAELAENPGHYQTRVRAARRARAIFRSAPEIDAPPESALMAANIALAMIVSDVMLFAGIEPDPLPI